MSNADRQETVKAVAGEWGIDPVLLETTEWGARVYSVLFALSVSPKLSAEEQQGITRLMDRAPEVVTEVGRDLAINNLVEFLGQRSGA